MWSRIPLRPRTVVALGLAALVIFVVAIGKLMGGPTTPLSGEPPAATELAVDPDAGDDGVKIDTTPSAFKPSGSPAAETLATAFAKNWIRHDRSAKDWLNSLRPMCTETLLAELDGVDPVGVPANRLTGPAHVEALADSYVEISIGIDAGTLRLRLVAPEGKWLVDGIDWERA